MDAKQCCKSLTSPFPNIETPLYIIVLYIMSWTYMVQHVCYVTTPGLPLYKYFPKFLSVSLCHYRVKGFRFSFPSAVLNSFLMFSVTLQRPRELLSLVSEVHSCTAVCFQAVLSNDSFDFSYVQYKELSETRVVNETVSAWQKYYAVCAKSEESLL